MAFRSLLLTKCEFIDQILKIYMKSFGLEQSGIVIELLGQELLLKNLRLSKGSMGVDSFISAILRKEGDQLSNIFI